MTTMARRSLAFAAAMFGLAAMVLAPHLVDADTTAAVAANPATPATAALVSFETVPVGDPGNAADPATGYGAVAGEFRIGKHEMTIADYVVFLNVVASVPRDDAINALYKEPMADPHQKEDTGRLIERTGAGTPADPFVYVASASAVWPDAAQRPVPWVTWFDAARFANWLHNGATPSSDTETGAYSLVDFQESGFVARNDDARFWIPSEDEWYKAAYFDPTRPGDNKYWNFPTSSDRPPRFAAVSDAPAAPAANFQNVYKGSDAGVLVPVGSYPTSTSHYGTLDQGGELWEWTEAAYPDEELGPNRIVRGGSWGPGITPLQKTVRRDYGPMGSDPFYFDDDTGFRLATAF